MKPCWLAITLGAMCVAPAALADKKQCANAYVEAQKARKDGALKKAREQLILCGKDDCLAAVKKDCIEWLDEVNASLPSIVIEAKGPDGKDTFDVKVSVDGEVVREKLDVKAIDLDPGTHKLVFEYSGQPPIEQEVVLREGQKNKTIQVSFKKAEEAKPAPMAEPDEPIEPEKKPASKKPPVVSYVLGGVGLVALGATGYFWLKSQSETKKLEDSGCEPNCDENDVDSIKRKRLFGDIALGVGVVSLGAAAYFWLQPRKPSAPAEATLVNVRVGPRGGYAGVSGSF